MNAVRETEIDGVLCFFVDTGRPASSAHLIFRQGLADEPLHESGWLRLLEHLALLDRETLSRPIEGTVTMLTTGFRAHGGEVAVVDRLRELSRWLGEPDLRLLARERGVLQAEAQRRSDPLLRSLTWRYGATGPGVASYAEAGSVRATPELLAERAQRVFNRSNAVLVLDGPPPATVSLPLPSGEYRPSTPAPTLDRRLPAAYVDDSGVTLSGTVPRSHEAEFLPDLLERAVHDGLRQRTGGVYAPWARMERVDDRHLVVATGSDVVPEMLRSIAGVGHDISRRLADEGVPRAWLTEAVDARLRALDGPRAALDVALGAAYAVLGDQVPKTHEELVHEARATDPDLVDAAVRAFHETLLVGVPEGARLDGGLRTVDFPETEPASTASRHRHVNWPADLATFSANDEFLESATGTSARSLRVDDVVALFAWRDGTRKVVARDGSSLEMEPTQWYRGHQLTAALDRAVPADLHVPMPDRVVTFRRMGPAERCAITFGRVANTVPGIAVMLGVSLLLVLIGVLGGHRLLGAVFVLLAGALGAHLWRLQGGRWPGTASAPGHAA